MQGNDSIEEFVTRLTISARDCDFGDHADEMIRDRIVFGCRSERVREKLIEKGRDLNLRPGKTNFPGARIQQATNGGHEGIGGSRLCLEQKPTPNGPQEPRR